VPGSLSLSAGGAEANVTVSVEELNGEQARKTIHPGEVATFWLNSFSLEGENFPSYEEGGEIKTLSYGGGEVELCWKGADELEAAVYYQESGSYKVARDYLDGAGSCSLEDEGDGLKATLTLADFAPGATNVKFINVRFYGDANQEVVVSMKGVGDNDLPRQGTIITSEATVNDVAREVVISRGWPVPPSFFDFALFSGGGLSK